jgi:hypothetical protein
MHMFLISIHGLVRLKLTAFTIFIFKVSGGIYYYNFAAQGFPYLEVTLSLETCFVETLSDHSHSII